MDAVHHSRRAAGLTGLLAAFLAAVLSAVLLAGCAGGPGADSSFFGGSVFGGPKTMAVQPIIGAPTKVGDQLVKLLVETGQTNGLTLIPSGEGAPYTLRGYLVANRESRGATVSYIWDVTDAKGTRVNRVSGEEQVRRPRSDPWSGVGEAELRVIAEKTTAALSGKTLRSAPTATASTKPETASPTPAAAPAAAPSSAPSTAAAPEAEPSSGGGLSGFFNRNFSGSGTTTTPAPAPADSGTTRTAAAPASVPSGPTTVVVAAVTGAPGDGRTSLANAIRKRLAASGVKIATSAGRNAYTVQPVVTLTSAAGGREKIRIDWRVIDPNGRRLGTVSQENTISKGSLSGPWGAIADAAANAAADGIIKLLPKRG